MFEGPGPHVFALPPGADFPAALVDGVRARMADHRPEAMAQVTIYLNPPGCAGPSTRFLALGGRPFCQSSVWSLIRGRARWAGLAPK